MREQERGAGHGQSVGALVLAAGRSQRMQGIDKTFAPILGEPLILHTLSAFLDCPDIERVVLVLPESSVEKARALIEGRDGADKVSVCAGGDRRQDSAAKGLAALGPCDWVAVHDGARPCLAPDTLRTALAEARLHGSAVVAVPVTDTVKRADPEGFISATVPRDGLWAMQTPQVFPFAVLRRAYREVSQDVTDDASMVERLGIKVRLVPGSPTNLKVTNPGDLKLAEMILKARGAGTMAEATPE